MRYNMFNVYYVNGSFRIVIIPLCRYVDWLQSVNKDPPDQNVYHAHTHSWKKVFFQWDAREFAKSRKMCHFAAMSLRNFEKG